MAAPNEIISVLSEMCNLKNDKNQVKFIKTHFIKPNYKASFRLAEKKNCIKGYFTSYTSNVNMNKRECDIFGV